MFKIVPIFVLNPHTYKKSTRSFFWWDNPSEYDPDNPSEYNFDYDCYWKKCLADSGIRGLTRYQGPVGHRTDYSEYDYVNASQLLHNYPALYALLKHEVSQMTAGEFSLKESIDSNTLFRGGYAIEYGKAKVIYPRCCHTLLYFEEWQTVVEMSTSSKTGIWMGHPCIGIERISDAEFEISDSTDYFCPEVEFEPFRVSHTELIDAVASCQRTLRRLQQEIPPIVKIIRRDAWRRLSEVT
jgi:hypothetical protein